jgi:hypothetical protein
MFEPLLSVLDIWHALQIIRNEFRTDMFQLEATVMLLKFADAMLHDDEETRAIQGVKLTYFIPIMEDLANIGCWIPLRDPLSVPVKKLECMKDCLRLLFSIFQTYLDPEYAIAEPEDCLDLADAMICIDFFYFISDGSFLASIA